MHIYEYYLSPPLIFNISLLFAVMDRMKVVYCSVHFMFVIFQGERGPRGISGDIGVGGLKVMS